MIRCIYLLSLTDLQRREKLVTQFERGDRWPISDANMVKLSNRLHGWTKSVYRFGCAFIHLSKYNDASKDPFDELSTQERKEIADHLAYYHGFTINEGTKLRDIAPILPGVFEKIADNLECYVRDLEKGTVLDA